MHPLVVNKNRDEFDVDVTRQGKWGNPFTHIGSAPEAFRCGSKAEAVRLHAQWMLRRRALMLDLPELTGLRLGCACEAPPCHAETLARRANNPFTLIAYAHPRFRN